MTTVEADFTDMKIRDVETTAEKAAVIARVDDFSSPAELRATLWEQIATHPDAKTIDGEAMYETVVNSVYDDILEAAREQLGIDGPEDGSEATASASATDADRLEDVPDRLNPWAGNGESLEEYGSGVDGDTTREDHLKREEQIDLLSKALERADVHKDADGDRNGEE